MINYESNKSIFLIIFIIIFNIIYIIIFENTIDFKKKYVRVSIIKELLSSSRLLLLTSYTILAIE